MRYVNWIYSLKIILAILPIWFIPPVYGQSTFQRYYSVEEGLLYPEADMIRFTRDGDAWIRYISGEWMSRFDGIHWEHFHLPVLGLPTNLVFMAQNKQGIWFYHYDHENRLTLVRFNGENTWKKFELGKNMIFLPDLNDDVFNLLDDQLFYWTWNDASDTFVRRGRSIISKQTDENISSCQLTDDGGMLFEFLKKGSKEVGWLHNGQAEMRYRDLPTSFSPLAVRQNILYGTYEQAGTFYWYAGSHHKPIRIRLPSGRTGEPVDRVSITTIYPFIYGTVLNGIVVKDPASGELFLYELDEYGHTELRIRCLHRSYLEGSFCKDRLGNIWYTNSTSAIRSYQSMLVFSEDDPEMVGNLQAIGEDARRNIWMGGYSSKGFSVFDGNRLLRYDEAALPYSVMPGSWKSPTGFTFFSSEDPTGLLAINQESHLTLRHWPYRVAYYFLSLTSGKTAIGLNHFGLGLASESNGYLSMERTVSKEKGMLLENVLTIAEDTGGRLWLGRASQGMAVFDPVRDTAVTWLRSPNQPANIGVMSSCIDINGDLWLGGNIGLYHLHEPHHFDYLRTNPSDRIQKIVLPGHDTTAVHILKETPDFIVAGTLNGVYFLDKKYEGNRLRIFSMRFGKEIHGGGCEQNAVLLDSRGYLWVGSQEGATRLDLDQLRFDTLPTTIRLLQFQAGNQTIPVVENRMGRIPAGMRHIRFQFIAAGNAFMSDNIFYDILITNHRRDTLFQRFSTDENDIQLEYVPHGSYRMYIAAYKNNVLSGTAAYVFVIPRLLGEKPLFWISMAVLGLSLPFLWYWFYNRFQKMALQHQLSVEQAGREKDALKIQVLSNFFNPHFINNALHWVQSKYRRDPDTATIIGRLAENVNILFQNTQSGKAWHSLRSEIEIVNNYLKIQQVRFDNTFHVEYTAEVEDAVLDIVMVPSLLLQIHAENAVEKGIRNRKSACSFSWSIVTMDEGLLISMEDDGRGRPLDIRVVHSANRQRRSTQMMHDMISLLNRYNRHHIAVSYFDDIFISPSGERYGTRVQIFLPTHFQYEISQMESPGDRR